MAGSTTTWWLRYDSQVGNKIVFWGEDQDGNRVMPSEITVEPATAVIVWNNEVTIKSDISQITVNAQNSDGYAENCPLTVSVVYTPPADTTKKDIKLNGETIEAIFAGTEKVHAILLNNELVYGTETNK